MGQITSGMLTSLCVVREPEMKRKGTVTSGMLTSLCVVSELEMTRNGTNYFRYAYLTLRCQYTGNDEVRDDYLRVCLPHPAL